MSHHANCHCPRCREQEYEPLPSMRELQERRENALKAEVAKLYEDEVNSLKKQVALNTSYQDLFQAAMQELADLRDNRATTPGALRVKARIAYLNLRNAEADMFTQRARLRLTQKETTIEPR